MIGCLLFLQHLTFRYQFFYCEYEILLYNRNESGFLVDMQRVRSAGYRRCYALNVRREHKFHEYHVQHSR